MSREVMAIYVILLKKGWTVYEQWSHKTTPNTIFVRLKPPSGTMGYGTQLALSPQ